MNSSERTTLSPKYLNKKYSLSGGEYVDAPFSTKNRTRIAVGWNPEDLHRIPPLIKWPCRSTKPKILADINAELGKPVLTDLRIEIHQIHTAQPHETEDGSSTPETSKEDSIIDDTHQESHT